MNSLLANRRAAWWSLLIAAITLTVLLCLVIGQITARRVDPAPTGISRVGEWFEVPDQDVLLRIDELNIVDSIPNQEWEPLEAAEGMVLIQIIATIEPLTEAAKDASCYVVIENAEGDELFETESVDTGPPIGLTCTEREDKATQPFEVGRQFQSQQIVSAPKLSIDDVRINVHYSFITYDFWQVIA